MPRHLEHSAGKVPEGTDAPRSSFTSTRRNAIASLVAGATVLFMPILAQAGGGERGTSWDRIDYPHQAQHHGDRAARSECLADRDRPSYSDVELDRREPVSRRASIGWERARARHSRGTWRSRDRERRWRASEARRDRRRHAWNQRSFEPAPRSSEVDEITYEVEESIESALAGAPAGHERIEADRPHLEREILTLTNEVRRAHGLEPLAWNSALGHAARYHAADMATHGYFSHDSYVPTASGDLEHVMSAHQRAEAFGVTDGMAENIAYNRTEAPARVVQQWLDSEGHRRNLLDPDLRTLGVGHHEGFWVQNFGF
jgi:uncharacterized protein YkwD